MLLFLHVFACDHFLCLNDEMFSIGGTVSIESDVTRGAWRSLLEMSAVRFLCAIYCMLQLQQKYVKM